MQLTSYLTSLDLTSLDLISLDLTSLDLTSLDLTKQVNMWIVLKQQNNASLIELSLPNIHSQ